MYFCAYRPGGEALTRGELFGAISRLRAATTGELDYLLAGPFAAAVVRSPLRRRIARRGSIVAAGDVRLDNRAELVRMLRSPIAPDAGDLDVVTAAIDDLGEACIARIIGDYSFVVWDARAQKVLAVRDAFGVKPLYMRAARDVMLFSSLIGPLQSEERLDTDYVADFLVGMHGQGQRTIWSDVSAVPAAHYARQQGTVRTLRRHWDATAFEPSGLSDAEATEQFATLFSEAVTSRVQPGVTWAQLSGGLDSSSIVAEAATRGGSAALAGTLTSVDTLGNGDETRYSDQVVQRYRLRNEQVHDFWAWQDDGRPAPRTDQPGSLYPFYARDRRLHATVRDNGGRVVLSGLGADHYLTPTLDYVTDMAAHGRLRAAMGELLGWSVALRQSFWTLARAQTVTPFLPAGLRRTAQTYRTPAWVRSDFARAHHLDDRVPYCDSYIGRPGGRVRRQTASNLTALQAWTDSWPWGDDIELRYPFLHRPLVEAVLQMPVDKRIRPGTQKWVLRQAVRDKVPADIHKRQGKGGIDARILWSLRHEQGCVDNLLKQPALVDLGIIDGPALRAAVSDAKQGVARNNVYLMSALALETWLTVRAGRPLAARQAAQSAA